MQHHCGYSSRRSQAYRFTGLATLALSLIFVLALLELHLGSAAEERKDLALSQLRDVSAGVDGYILFGMLLGIGLSEATGAFLGKRVGEVLLYALASALLLVVALTPSTNADHVVFSIQLFILLFGTFAYRLWKLAPPLAYFHFAMPVVIFVATGAQSYGTWQKWFIVYLLAGVNVLALARLLGLESNPPAFGLPFSAAPSRRRVFRLDSSAGKWRR